MVCSRGKTTKEMLSAITVLQTHIQQHIRGVTKDSDVFNSKLEGIYETLDLLYDFFHQHIQNNAEYLYTVYDVVNKYNEYIKDNNTPKPFTTWFLEQDKKE